VQAYLLAGTERVLSVTLPDETFRVRVLRLNHACPLEPRAALGREVDFTYRQDGWLQMRQAFRPGPVTVRLRNEAPHVVVAVIERVQRDRGRSPRHRSCVCPSFANSRVWTATRRVPEGSPRQVRVRKGLVVPASRTPAVRDQGGTSS